MNLTKKVIFAALVAGLALTAASGAAWARTAIGVTGGPISSSASALTFEEGGEGLGVNVICDITLNGELHEGPIEKVEGALIGYITEASEANCSSNLPSEAGVRFLLFPWHVQYVGFTGELPEINTVTIRVVEAGFLLLIHDPIFGGHIECLYKGSFLATSNSNVATNGITNLIPGSEFQQLFQALGAEGGFCPARGRLVAKAEGFTLAEPVEVELVD